MDEETRIRFEELDKRISQSGKRLGDIKWYFGIGFSALVIVVGWNLTSEKNSLREFQKDIKADYLEFKKEVKADIGKPEGPPDLKLLGTNGNALENQDIKCYIITENGSLKLKFKYRLKNEGISISGPLYQKIYTNEPIILTHDNTD